MVVLFPHLNMAFHSVWLIVKAIKIFMGWAGEIKVTPVSVEGGGNQEKCIILSVESLSRFVTCGVRNV